LEEREHDTSSAPVRDQDAILSGELIEGGYLEGGVMRGADGTIVGSSVTGISVQGRLFLQQLRKEEREDSLVGKGRKWVPVLVGYLAGLLSPVITDWLKAVLHLTTK
jgi:hypothetical protein